MKKGQQRLSPGANVGFISLLMIVMVLCLTMFVALSLTSAHADRVLTDRTGATISDYYTAQNEYQGFLAELDAVLVNIDWNTVDAQAVGRILDGSLALLINDRVAFDKETRLIRASWPAGERLVLQAEILVNTANHGARYSVQSLVTVTATDNL